MFRNSSLLVGSHEAGHSALAQEDSHWRVVTDSYDQLGNRFWNDSYPREQLPRNQLPRDQLPPDQLLMRSTPTRSTPNKSCYEM